MSITDTTVRRRESPARRRVLDAASSLFYAEGVHAVGIDRVIAEAGVAKATFYHHFPSKDALVCAYLEGEDARVRQLMAPAGDTPQDRVLWVFEALGEHTCGPGFRGCAFINAAAEYPDRDHPVRRVIAVHRAWLHGVLRDLLAAGHHPDPPRTATMLMMLRDGLVVGGDLDDPAEARAVIRTAVSRVIG
jgi:AcrR family transcriptional regulator